MNAFLAGLFHAPWMLIGLAVLLIPPLIHLLNRRRYDVVDWGAMQFLQVSDAVRRKLLIEELLLMLLRMGLLAVLVLALAGPFLDVRLPAGFGSREARDAVLVIDGSASMGARGDDGGSPAEKAKEWAERWLAELGQGDAVAVLHARETPVAVTGELSADRDRARRLLGEIAEPAGTCDWAAALRAAHALLEKSQQRRREIVLLTDNQKFGVADGPTLFKWELLASELGLNLPEPPDRPRPRVRMIDLAAGRAAALPNYALEPLRTNRPV
ncbi:MAG: VWA domain-containing protein, partial [Gemmataceae bacterium]|nr:VWA domain-containing protein [Gemmataceae bacterium]